jgi:hypothetical protein
LPEEHIEAKDLKVVRTWGQRLSVAAGKAVAKKLLGEAEGEVVEAGKVLVKGLLTGEKEERD